MVEPVSPIALSGALVVGAYLLGSIPVGLFMARARGVDIREQGSGNIGATNVARTIGKKLGAIVLVLDALKGALPVLTVLLLELDTEVDPFVITATGFSAICGHCYPVWLRFHGGKGVATSLGVFLVVAPLVAAIGVAIFVALYAAFRVASIGSLVGAASFPVQLLLMGGSDAVLTLSVAGFLVVLIKHRDNIARLIRREENTV